MEYELPEMPAVLFFYSPFREQVMERVVARIRASVKQYPRSMVLLFYGFRPETRQVLDSLGWERREIPVPRDPGASNKYLAFAYSNPSPVHLSR